MSHTLLTQEYLDKRMYAGKFLSQLYRVNPDIIHSPGVTYLCKHLDSGYLKIGYSENIEARLVALDDPALLYTLVGGESLELIAHYELSDFRIPRTGEIFFDLPPVKLWFERRIVLDKKLGRDISVVPMEHEVQFCKVCHLRKPFAAFGRNSSSRTGWYITCRVCRSRTSKRPF